MNTTRTICEKNGLVIYYDPDDRSVYCEAVDYHAGRMRIDETCARTIAEHVFPLRRVFGPQISLMRTIAVLSIVIAGMMIAFLPRKGKRS